jgi:putative GTP pyrophosphokinase
MASKSGTPTSEALLNSPRVREAARWYDDHMVLHKRLATKVEQLLIDILSGEKLPFASITFRVKDRESFLKKASKQKYSDPASQIKDVVGLRVTTYFESTATKACEVIKREFAIDPQHSLDKSEALGTDKVGYRSVHFIAMLSPERTRLPECRATAKLTPSRH